MSWASVGVAVASAGAGIYSSQQAAKAQGKGAKDARALQQQQYNNALTMLEPQRALGYGALSDIASLYNYTIPQYTPLDAIRGGAYGGGAPVTVEGSRNEGQMAGIGMNPLSSGSRRFGGTINPYTGEVELKGIKKQKKEDRLEREATAYLRGETDKLKGAKWKRIRGAIEDMRDAGYQYAPPAANAAPVAGPTGQPGNMSRFFTSPDYQFRRDEGQRDIGNSFAARGGAASGNALRALSQFNSNLASQEFGNYTSRLMQMAGMGSAATNNAVQTGQQYAANAGNAIQAQGDARASGIMGAGNSVINAANAGMNNYLLSKYLRQPAPAVPQPTTNFGPWANGYRFGD